MNKLYGLYLKDLDQKNYQSLIYTLFVNDKSKNYLDNTSNNQIVKDFIAGMTDDFFILQIKKNNT